MNMASLSLGAHNAANKAHRPSLVALPLSADERVRPPPLTFDRASLQAIAFTLIFLDVSGNRLTTLREVALLRNLKKLVARDNDISDVNEIAVALPHMQWLVELDVRGNPCCNSHLAVSHVHAQSHSKSAGAVGSRSRSINTVGTYDALVATGRSLGGVASPSPGAPSQLQTLRSSTGALEHRSVSYVDALQSLSAIVDEGKRSRSSPRRKGAQPHNSQSTALPRDGAPEAASRVQFSEAAEDGGEGGAYPADDAHGASRAYPHEEQFQDQYPEQYEQQGQAQDAGEYYASVPLPSVIMDVGIGTSYRDALVAYSHDALAVLDGRRIPPHHRTFIQELQKRRLNIARAEGTLPAFDAHPTDSIAELLNGGGGTLGSSRQPSRLGLRTPTLASASSARGSRPQSNSPRGHNAIRGASVSAFSDGAPTPGSPGAAIGYNSAGFPAPFAAGQPSMHDTTGGEEDFARINGATVISMFVSEEDGGHSGLEGGGSMTTPSGAAYSHSAAHSASSARRMGSSSSRGVASGALSPHSSILAAGNSQYDPQEAFIVPSFRAGSATSASSSQMGFDRASNGGLLTGMTEDKGFERGRLARDFAELQSPLSATGPITSDSSKAALSTMFAPPHSAASSQAATALETLTSAANRSPGIAPTHEDDEFDEYFASAQSVYDASVGATSAAQLQTQKQVVPNASSTPQGQYRDSLAHSIATEPSSGKPQQPFESMKGHKILQHGQGASSHMQSPSQVNRSVGGLSGRPGPGTSFVGSSDDFFGTSTYSILSPSGRRYSTTVFNGPPGLGIGNPLGRAANALLQTRTLDPKVAAGAKSWRAAMHFEPDEDENTVPGMDPVADLGGSEDPLATARALRMARQRGFTIANNDRHPGQDVPALRPRRTPEDFLRDSRFHRSGYASEADKRRAAKAAVLEFIRREIVRLGWNPRTFLEKGANYAAAISMSAQALGVSVADLLSAAAGAVSAAQANGLESEMQHMETSIGRSSVASPLQQQASMSAYHPQQSPLRMRQPSLQSLGNNPEDLLALPGHTPILSLTDLAAQHQPRSMDTEQTAPSPLVRQSSSSSLVRQSSSSSLVPTLQRSQSFKSVSIESPRMEAGADGDAGAASPGAKAKLQRSPSKRTVVGDYSVDGIVSTHLRNFILRRDLPLMGMEPEAATIQHPQVPTLALLRQESMRRLHRTVSP
jgi:hypothetical protein